MAPYADNEYLETAIIVSHEGNDYRIVDFIYEIHTVTPYLQEHVFIDGLRVWRQYNKFNFLVKND